MSEELADLPILEELGAALVAGFRRREVRRLPRPLYRFAALAAAAAIGAGIVLTSQLGGGGTAQASAAQVLRAAAVAVETQPVRVPRANQFFFFRYLTTNLNPIRKHQIYPLPIFRAVAGPTARVTTYSWESWSLKRFGKGATRVLSIRLPTASASELVRWRGFAATLRHSIDNSGISTLGPIGPRVVLSKHRSLTLAQLFALPRNPRTLYRRLFAGDSGSVALSAVSELGLFPLQPRAVAAVYRALALVPGIRDEGRARVVTGRVGIVLGAPLPGGPEIQLVLDPGNGRVLAERTVTVSHGADDAPAGTVLFETATTLRKVTNSPWPPQAKH
jgi:hypothetical protein